MIYFNPKDEKCKSPFGAVSTKETVTFNIKCNGFDCGYFCYDNKQIKLTPTKTGFTCSLNFDNGTLIFYYFMLITNNGIKIYIENTKSIFSSKFSQKMFQLTVYETSGAPKWFREGILYQIFPDRFAIEEKINRTKKDAFIYEDTKTIPRYIKNEKGEIVKWDYFGGNLNGITKKLDYIKSFNVRAIYLNPIFSANSNHRYNTADFSKIDSMLGSEEDLKTLIYEAHKRDIKIILDGVFSHVGADSIYFNKFKNFNTNGAYNHKNSPYYPWFKFDDFPHKYKGWWGNADLPEVNELTDSFIKYILTNENSIVKKWTRMGIGGWRLDVADELPDEFIEILNKTVKEINPDAVIIGEVWEDASNKIAYGKRKTYFTKKELDCVMNYPLRDNLIAFYKNEIDAFELKNRFDTLMENYPHNCFYGNFNLLGTHDTERIFTIAKLLSEDYAESILESMVNLQFFFPGTPCIYYGDEAGLEGFKDPDNRRFYPWGKENKNIMNIYKNASSLRHRSPALQSGKTEFLSPHKDVFGIKRYNDTENLSIFVNRNDLDISFNINDKIFNLPPFGYFI